MSQEGGRQQVPKGLIRQERLKKGRETDQGDVGDGMRAPHLQLLHLAGPAAAFLTVDTADGQRQNLLLQLRVRVDLENQKEIKKVNR